MDPLSLLRESTINNKPVVLLDAANAPVTNISDAKSIKFNDDAIFARDTPTNFKKTAAADSDTYTLETLIFLVQNAQLDNSAYFKECRTRQIEHVSIVDRRKILDYLTGKVDQSPNVTQANTTGKLKISLNTFFFTNNVIEKRSRDDVTSMESLTKKPKVTPLKSDDSLVIVKQVVLREREILTRSSVLKGNKNFTHAINLAQQLVLKKEVPVARPTTQKPGVNQTTKPAISNPAKTAAAVKSQKLSSKDKIPLIIVPAAPTAKFTLYNIKQFLEDQK